MQNIFIFPSKDHFNINLIWALKISKGHLRRGQIISILLMIILPATIFDCSNIFVGGGGKWTRPITRSSQNVTFIYFLVGCQSFVFSHIFHVPNSTSLLFLSFCNPTISRISLSKFQDATDWIRNKIFNIFRDCHTSQKKCFTSLKWQRSQDVSSCRHGEETNPVVSGFPTNKYCQNWNWQGKTKSTPSCTHDSALFPGNTRDEVSLLFLKL